MLEQLNDHPADKILELMQLYREDPRTEKVDLGVGVYKNADGHAGHQGGRKDAVGNPGY
jgi:aromatic-amino-acid transaminase